MSGTKQAVFCAVCVVAVGQLCFAGLPVPREAAFALAKPGAVKPAGWLRDWAETMAKGYTARMDEVDAEFVRAWKPDFQPRGKKLHWSQGTWSCEGGAYWFDGLVKLAFQLDDAALKAQAKRRLDPILDNMTDTPIGFCWWLNRTDPAHFQEVYDSSDWMVNWVAGILTRPISAWYQATGDARAKRALECALGDAYWNTCFRNESADCVAGSVISIPSGALLAERVTGSPKIAAALRAYARAYAKNPARETYGPAPTKGLEKTLGLKRAEMKAQKIPLRHGVVANETLHSLFVSAFVTGDKGLWNSWRRWMDFLDTHARLPVGAWVMDEEWGHPGPRRGVETCALAAEAWGRLDFLATLGQGRYGDDIERAFFNAAPASVTRDCRAHVYFQQPNRLKGGDSERLSVRGAGTEQTLFQEKHCPLCCTAGLNRLVPDFIQGLWMTTADGGVAATLYAPCTFEMALADGTFAVSEETDYPFGETIALKVKSAPSVAFPLALRIPGWCGDAVLAVNGKTVDIKSVDGFVKMRRIWRTGDVVTLRLPMKPRVEIVRDLDETQRDYACVVAGPLLFARGFAEKTANEPAEPTVVPTVDPRTVAAEAQLVRRPLSRPFDWPLAAPLLLRTQDAAGQPLKLVPYGCTKLRVSMFGVSSVSDAARNQSEDMNARRASADEGVSGGVRVLFLGNSITLHGSLPEIGWTNEWGMAASAKEKDYVHLVARGIEEKSRRKAEIRIRNLADFERGFRVWNVEKEHAEDLEFAPDYLVIALGENVSLETQADNQAFAAAFDRLLGHFMRGAKRPKGAVRGVFWANRTKDALMRRVAEKHKLPFVDAGIADLPGMKAKGLFWHRGVQNHPGDGGMAEIARRILGALFPK